MAASAGESIGERGALADWGWRRRTIIGDWRRLASGGIDREM
jgi:hypothetical protein